MLTEEYRRKRCKFCFLKVDEELMMNLPNYDVVHINEKWFYMTKEGDANLDTGEEDLAYRESKSKGFIKKIYLHGCISLSSL